MIIEKDYYINLLIEGNILPIKTINNFRSSRLATIMANATVYGEYMGSKEFKELVDNKSIKTLMTYTCRGQSAVKVVENLIMYGFNYENIVCISDGHDVVIKKAFNMMDNNENITTISKYLDDNLFTEVCVVIPYNSELEIPSRLKKLYSKMYIPSSPISNDIGRCDEDYSSYFKIDLKRKNEMESPIYESETFIQLLSRGFDINKLTVKLTIDGKSEYGKRPKELVGVLVQECLHGNVFWKYSNEIHKALRE